jgi:DNA-binding MarR family transcriptional regulator
MITRSWHLWQGVEDNARPRNTESMNGGTVAHTVDTGPGIETGTQSGGSTAPAGAVARPSLLYIVKQVELAMKASLDELVKPVGITTMQYTALTVLRRRDRLSSAQLARNSFVTPQSMADTVTTLEQQGLIVRRRNPDNRRVLLLSLTDAGRSLLAGLDTEVEALEDRMAERLTPRQRRDLEVYLERCHGALTDLPSH